MLCKPAPSAVLPARRHLLEASACLGLQFSQISLPFLGHATSRHALSASSCDLVAIAPPASATAHAVLPRLGLHASPAGVRVDSGDAQSSHRSPKQLALSHDRAALVHGLGRIGCSCSHAWWNVAKMVVLSGGTRVGGTRRAVKDRIVILKKKLVGRIRGRQRMACKREHMIITVMGSRLVMERGVLDHGLVGMRGGALVPLVQLRSAVATFFIFWIPALIHFFLRLISFLLKRKFIRSVEPQAPKRRIVLVHVLRFGTREEHVSSVSRGIVLRGVAESLGLRRFW